MCAVAKPCIFHRSSMSHHPGTNGKRSGGSDNIAKVQSEAGLVVKRAVQNPMPYARMRIQKKQWPDRVLLGTTSPTDVYAFSLTAGYRPLHELPLSGRYCRSATRVDELYVRYRRTLQSVLTAPMGGSRSHGCCNLCIAAYHGAGGELSVILPPVR